MAHYLNNPVFCNIHGSSLSTVCNQSASCVPCSLLGMEVGNMIGYCCEVTASYRSQEPMLATRLSRLAALQRPTRHHYGGSGVLFTCKLLRSK
eukprot:6455759-Amphidinium_carterae.2